VRFSQLRRTDGDIAKMAAVKDEVDVELLVLVTVLYVVVETKSLVVVFEVLLEVLRLDAVFEVDEM
jgi:hypothetical protein